MTSAVDDATASIQEEITDLEERLQDARARLDSHNFLAREVPATIIIPPTLSLPVDFSTAHLHALLLLSDSALPIGSFAYSSGLESFLAHQPKRSHNSSLFSQFLALSLDSISSTTLPYVIAGYKTPSELEDLDNDLDASTTCTVARRASTQQGRALLAVWERSFKQHLSPTSVSSTAASIARMALEALAALLKRTPHNKGDGRAEGEVVLFVVNGHLAPLFGALCAALEIPLAHVLYIFLLNHAKMVVSAAIRASLLGPYQAQGVIASEELQRRIWSIVDEDVRREDLGKGRMPEEAGQSVPVMDL